MIGRDDCEDLWNKLRVFHLPSALHQSIVEQRLPFGMKRKLPILEGYEGGGGGGDEIKVLKATDFLVNLKDPYAVGNGDLKRLEPKPSSGVLDARASVRNVISNSISSLNGTFNNKVNGTVNTAVHAVNLALNKAVNAASNIGRFKFVPQKTISACNSCLFVDDTKSIKFDPSALLFFKETGEVIKSNLTSNANGTVSNDKNHLGSILNQGCWLTSLPDLLKNCSNVMPQVQNNKLRCLKYAEFITQEWQDFGRKFGNDVEFIAINAPNTILMSKKRSKLYLMDIILIDKNGNIKFTSKLRKREFEELVHIEDVNIVAGDTIILIRSRNEVDLNLIIKTILKCSISEDLEDSLITCLDDKGKLPCALLVSKVYYTKQFDDSFSTNGGHKIKYKSHLDTKIGMIVNNQAPGPYGCTTRHSAIYREGYFAALHHDASKINRFPDTINYIIRKLGNPLNLGKRMEQEGDVSVLKRISDVQYFAYFLKVKNEKILLGLGGGAKCIVISKNLNEIQVHEIPILIELKEIKKSDQIILLSPHFPPSFRIKTIRAPTIQAWLKQLMEISQVDVKSIKVSLLHFEIL